MNRKIGGIVLAVVLAIAGTAALITFVQRAKDDAVSGEELIEVLVLTENVRQGAPLGEIDDAIELTKVPQRLIAPDTLRTLADVDPILVAGVDLLAGDQLQSSRLVNPDSLVRVDVPAGLQELSIVLDPQRAVGGAPKPGDRVGILFSFETSGAPGTTTTTVTPPDPSQPALVNPSGETTKLTLNQILVTSVQISQGDAERQQAETVDGVEGAPTVNEAPAGSLLLTLAVTTPQAEQIVFSAEFGTIWLTLQNDDTNFDGSRILTIDQVYVTVLE